MELLPNSKCLTKIKNHLQLGLIRELIGLLPVGKQWGVKTLTETHNWDGTVSLPLSVNTIYSIATTLNSCPSYAIVGIAIQSTGKSSFSVKLDGVNDSSRATGFKYILVAK